MRDRLIELLEQAEGLKNNDIPSLEEKADYLLANGVIVPPCKVGDIIWVYDFMWGLIPCKVDEPYHYVCGDGRGCTVSGNFADKDIGEWVFLSKQDAEKRLRELNGQS